MTIATIDDIAAALAASKTHFQFNKLLSAPKAIGTFHSAWMATGFPGPGVASPVYTAGSGYTASAATTGALNLGYVNASVQNWLPRLSGSASLALTLIIADRLWSCSGMGFAASTYTVTTPGSLPARITDSGVGCELWVEQFATAGAASGTLTANYLNTASASKSGVIAAVQSAPLIGQMQQVPLAAGDSGISQLTSVVNNATWTSGSWGMTILKRLAEIPIVAPGIGANMDWAALGLPKLVNDMCFMAFIVATSTTAPQVIGSMDVIDK